MCEAKAYSYLVTIVVLARSDLVYEIFTNQIKFQKFDLENEDQGQEREKWDLRHSIENVWFYTGEFFSPRSICLHGYSHSEVFGSWLKAKYEMHCRCA